MRLVSHANNLETNIEVESQNFGIGDASVVIEILRNRLYQHKVRTLVQEYICNARDAHRELGSTAPIQVTIPNRFSLTFKVRDFGPGISPDRMRDVFVMYGSSTKRANNKQTGGFGIGAKSAWSYTDSFTIVTFVDGVKRTYVAHTGVSNTGRLDLIETTKTQEVNGTEIQIAVKSQDVDEFRDSAFRAVHFWTVKPVFKGLVDIQGVGTHKGFKVGSHFEAVESLPQYLIGNNYSLNGKVIIVIDGVPYPIDRELIERVKSLKALMEVAKHCGVLYVGNGVLEVSASREQLTDTPLTIQNLEKLSAKVLSEVLEYIKSEFAKVKSVSEFLDTYSQQSKRFYLEDKAEYKGYKIQFQSINGNRLKEAEIVSIRKNHRGAMKRTKRSDIDLSLYGRIYFESTKESKVAFNRRLKTLLLANPGGVVILSKHVKTTLKEFDRLTLDLNAIDLNTVAQTKTESVARTKRDSAAICAHIPSTVRRYTETIQSSSSAKYVYVTLKDGDFSEGINHLADLNAYLKGFNIIGLAPTVVNRIKDLTNFQSLEDFLKDYKPVKKDIENAKRSQAKSYEIMSRLLKATGIKCKFFSKMQKEYQELPSNAQDFPSILLKVLNKNKEVMDFIDQDKSLTDSINSKYSLLKLIDAYTNMRGQEAEWSVYINAKT